MTQSRASWLLLAALGLALLAAGCSDLLELDEFSGPSTSGSGTATGFGGSGAAAGSGGGIAGGGQHAGGGVAAAGGGGSGGGTLHPSHLLVFVTDEAWPGAFDPLTEADDHCAERAALSTVISGTRQWKAWLSIGSEAAQQRISGDGPWTLVDNTPVFANHDQLTSGAGPSAGIDVDQYGYFQTGVHVWTGTDANGYAMVPYCSNWEGGGGYGVVGTAGSTDDAWTNASTQACTMSAHLYCFEQEP